MAFKGQRLDAAKTFTLHWKQGGFEGTGSDIVAGAGLFYDRHRAMFEMLATTLPRSGARAFAQLLERARAPTWRVWAVPAAYELKDALRARGYKCNGESNGSPRAWYIDVLAEQKDAEIHFLRTEIYRHDVDVLVRRIDAYNRFSDRA
jgi:DNA polymerase III subunit epsilon